MPNPPSPPAPPNSAFLPFRPPPKTPMQTFGGVRLNSTRKPIASAPAPKPRIPMPLSPQELPKKYRGAERKVRTVIVALPILIVTSAVLYQRLVLGEEQKHLDPAKAAAAATQN